MSTHGRPLREMVPMRVRCELLDPVVYQGDGMCLDGILSAAWFRDLPYELTSRWPSASRSDDWVRDLELPLARWAVPYAGQCDPRLRDEQGRVWGWCASAVHADWRLYTRAEVRRRVATDEMTRWTDAADVDIAAGRYKASDLRLPARMATHLEWYALGHVAEVRRVLDAHITAVGRKVGHGHGRVSRWVVERMDQDWSVTRHGRLTRPMPRGYMPGQVQSRGIRPLYWHPSRYISCVVPVESQLVPEAA